MENVQSVNDIILTMNKMKEKRTKHDETHFGLKVVRNDRGNHHTNWSGPTDIYIDNAIYSYKFCYAKNFTIGIFISRFILINKAIPRAFFFFHFRMSLIQYALVSDENAE